MTELPNQYWLYLPPQRRRSAAGPLLFMAALVVMLLVPLMLLASIVAVGVHSETVGVDLLAEVEEHDLGCGDVGSAESLSIGDDGQLYHWAIPVPGVSCFASDPGR